MNAETPSTADAKVIPLRRGFNQADLHRARREQVVLNHIVTILTQLLLSWRRPRPRRS